VHNGIGDTLVSRNNLLAASDGVVLHPPQIDTKV
jgi:hypothetical protein